MEWFPQGGEVMFAIPIFFLSAFVEPRVVSDFVFSGQSVGLMLGMNGVIICL